MADTERRLPVLESDLDKLTRQAGGLSAGMVVLQVNLKSTMDAYADRMPEPVRRRVLEALELATEYRTKYDIM